ncbi:LIC_11026 family protein [Leptospira wolffii]|uniref:LIC_11026 family protein n=1 Tax=Leptospira wolffii TaxID=409998 RepID=A0ABV5BSD8_9LEPT
MASDFLQYFQKRKLRFGILAGIFLLYHLLFNSITGQILFDKVCASSLTGTAKASVDSFSLFYGIKLSEVSILPTEEWGKEPVLRVRKLEFSYNLPLLLLGRLKLSKILVHGLEAKLVQKGKDWNFSSIFPPGKKEPEPETTEPLTKIRTYLPVSGFLELDLKDISLDVLSENGSQSYSAGLEGLELGFLLDTKRFTEIPLDLSVLDLIDEFGLRLNPEKKVRIRFQDSSRGLDHPFRLTWIWERQAQDGDSFHSHMDIGSENIPLRIANRLGAPFGFSFRYDLDFSPKKKELLLKNLEFKVGEDTWLEGGGKLSGIDSKSADVNISIQRSKIRLSPVSDFLHSLGMNNITLSGEASLAPVLAEGSFSNLRVLGEIRGNGLDFRIGKSRHRIPVLNLDWDMRIRSEKEEASAKFPLPWLQEARLKNLKIEYNEIRIGGDLNYSRSVGPACNLHVENFRLGEYLSGYSGVIGADLNLRGPDFSELFSDLKLKAKGFRFPMGRGNSSNIHLDGDLQAILRFPKKPWGLSGISVGNLDLRAGSPEGARAAHLKTSGVIGLGEPFVLDLKKANLNVDLGNLIPLLPLSLRESLIPVRTQIGNKLGLVGDFYYSIGDSSQDLQGSLGLDIPGMEIRDGKLGVKLKTIGSPSSKIQLDRLDLSAFQGKLSFRSQGNLVRTKSGDPPPALGDFRPDLQGTFSLRSSENSNLVKGLSFKGDLSLGFSWNGNIIQGKFGSRESDILVSNNQCPGYECKLYRIDGLNADVPFVHDVSAKETKNLIEGNKRKFVLNYGRIPKPNFTIRNIVGTHPSLKGAPFEYVKSKSDSPGLSANLDYSENYLRMDYLKVFTLDGEVWGKDVLVNVGSGSPEKMEFAASMRVKDIDLKQLLPAKSQSKIDDGKVKADLNLWGRNLADPIPNLNLFFSVYQIGNDFGKSAINIFAPSNLFTDFIYGSYAVDKIELELSKGLVYAVILFKRSVLGTLIQLENNQVSQQRMPLANFLKRAQSEIETFNK